MRKLNISQKNHLVDHRIEIEVKNVFLYSYREIWWLISTKFLSTFNKQMSNYFNTYQVAALVKLYDFSI